MYSSTDNETELDIQQVRLGMVALAIAQISQQYDAGEMSEDDLPTSASLARELRLNLDTVKKKIKELKRADLLFTLGMSPKRYHLNRYAVQHLSPSDPLYVLLCDDASPYCLLGHP